MKPEERANLLLETIEYINVSTCFENQPWNTPVYASCDENLNLYWTSWVEAQHSQNIRANEDVFITLYDSTRKRGSNHRRGLYLKAAAKEILVKDEIQKACDLLYNNTDNINLSDFMGKGVRRIYKASPLKAWLNNISEKQVTPGTKEMKISVPLDRLRLLQE